MEWLKTQILTAPKFVHWAARGLLSLGSFLLVAGLIGRACMLAVNNTREWGKLPPLDGLRDVYPALPMWWVPEGALGYVFSALAVVAGIYLVLVSSRVLNMMGGSRWRRYG